MPPLFCPQLCPTSPPLSHQRYPNASLSHIAHWNTTPGHIRVSHTLQPACASLPASFFQSCLYVARYALHGTASNLPDINSQAGLNQIAPFGFMHNHAPLTNMPAAPKPGLQKSVRSKKQPSQRQNAPHNGLTMRPKRAILSQKTRLCANTNALCSHTID